MASEFALRNLDWVENNRREVDRRSGGKLAYVYLPDTEYAGFTNFNRHPIPTYRRPPYPDHHPVLPPPGS